MRGEGVLRPEYCCHREPERPPKHLARLDVRHNIFMNTHADYIGRCIDNAVYIGLGVAMLLIVPRQMKRKLAAGTMTEEKAKKMTKIALVTGGVMVAYGIFRIFVG